MGFHKKTIKDVPIAGKTVLVRADFNVPLEKDGTIRDDFRIRAALPTIEYLIEEKCKIIFMSHLGRPDGKEKKYSLAPVAQRLAELTGHKVAFVDDCIGDRAYQTAKKTPKSTLVLFENLRFYAEEKANDDDFAKKIAKASGASYLVQDAFGTVHRAHASTDAITHHLPAVAGLLLEREYTSIESAIQKPNRPLVAVLGGAKVSDKITIVEKFVDIADTVLIGGAMANTFLAYKGFSVGKSMHETRQEHVLDEVYTLAEKETDGHPDELVRLPTDVAVAYSVSPDEPRREVKVEAIPADMMALDIGNQTIETYVKAVEEAGTVLWNGPVGYSELPQFAHGSARIALALASHPNVVSVVGGGDTADFVLKWDAGRGDSFTHVSTGGGAGLELMAGKKLPGVESLLACRR